jgi:hypothetical protein
VTEIMVIDPMIDFLTLLCTISLNYKPYSAIADLHNLQFTAVHAVGFSVSTSRLLVTDLNTETITSNHYEIFLPFLIQSPWTADSLNSDLRLTTELLSARTTHRKHSYSIVAKACLPLRCLAIEAPLLRGADHIETALYCCLLERV